MFVQLLKDFVGRKAGERIDVAEADAKALIANSTAQAVSDDLITPAVQKAMEQAFAGLQKGLDAVINTALKQFQDAQSQARKHAGPTLFGPGDPHGKTFGDWLLQVAIVTTGKGTPWPPAIVSKRSTTPRRPPWANRPASPAATLSVPKAEPPRECTPAAK
jgi:hypothetical protein